VAPSTEPSSPPTAEPPSELFDGVGVALVTLFDVAGELDAPATADHARRLVDGGGVRGLVVAGSTGEAAALDPDERSRLLTAVREAVGGDAQVIAGTGAPSARQAVALSRRAEDDGADALLVLSPPRAEDPLPYYEAVAAAVSIPILGYHWPAMSAPGIPVDMLRELPIQGLKDSTGDPERLAIEVEELPQGLYTGCAGLLLHARAIGCHGAILALANLDPDGCWRAWNGDGEAQRALVSGHRANARAGIAGLKRSICALHGTSVVTRLG
jgi:4-hydroxy-tetrahydrodipicolinate synthase